MSTEVTKKEVNLPANIVESPWGAEGTSQTDMIIPRLMLMQALSDFVSKGSATPGDIVESINGEVVAKKTQPLEVIAIVTHKEWWKFEMVQNKWEFRERVPYGPHNADWKYEETVNGTNWRNDAALNFFVILPNRLDGLPHLLTFRRSNYYAGKKLSTHFQISAMKKMPPAASVFTLQSQSTTVDKNTFWTFDIKKSRESTKQELATAYEWYQMLTKKPIKADDAADETVPF